MTHIRILSCLALSLTFAIGVVEAQIIDLKNSKIVDLSHTYNDKTLYWPNSPSHFEHTALAFGETPAGYFYSAYTLATPEHGGTHIDAPIHFDRDGISVEQIPLKQLILPIVVIDVAELAAKDRDYRLQVSDIEAFEKTHGKIPAGSAVLVRTLWDQYWPDAKQYLGDDTPGKTTDLHFPSFGVEATQFLIKKRDIALIGIDTASIDYGPSQAFEVHQIVGAKNIPDLENLTNLNELPTTGATLIALPMKIEGGSGAPVRAIAIVPNT